MNHNKLVENTKRFLNIASHKELQVEKTPKAEPKIVVENRLDQAVSCIDRMMGYSIIESKSEPIASEKIDKELKKFGQGRIVEDTGEVIYIGKANTGVVYTITQKSHDDFLVSFERPNGGKADLATYSTAQGALYMLQAQVPSIVATKDDITIIPIVHSEPIETHSFDDLHEETQLNKAINLILGEIGVSSLESLNEETKKEIISIATDLAQHI